MKNKILCIIFVLPLFAQGDEDKEISNWVFSPGYSIGFIKGESFTNYPHSGSIYFNPPIGFDAGPFYFDISMVYGNFKGNYYEYPKYPRHSPFWTGREETIRFNVPYFLFGGSLNLVKFLYTEGQIGPAGKGFGFRGLLGRDILNSVKDYQVKIGFELFFGKNLTGNDNISYIITSFCRVEIFLNRIKFKKTTLF